MLDRSIPPPLLTEFESPVFSPAIYRAGFIDIVHHPHVQQPVNKIEFVFNAGKWYEPKNSVAYFTALMLEKGMPNCTAHQIADRLESLGAYIETHSDADIASLSLCMLSKHFRNVLPLVMDLIRHSHFPAEEIQLAQELHLQQLQVNEQKNDFNASRALRKNLFGETHPYGRFMTAADIKNIEREDLIAFHRQYFKPIEIYITGEVSESNLNWLREEAAAFSAPGNHIPMHHAQSLEKYTTLPKADGLQCSIRMGQRTIDNNHPDFPALSLLNHILGGYFGSRLMTNIREEKGLTYSIYSYQTAYQHDTVFAIGADVNKDNTQVAISEIKKEWQKLRDEEIEANELEVAKNHLLGTVQLEMANPFLVTDKIKWLRLLHLSNEYYQDFMESIRRCDAQTLRATAQTYLAEEAWTCVVAG